MEAQMVSSYRDTRAFGITLGVASCFSTSGYCTSQRFALRGREFARQFGLGSTLLTNPSMDIVCGILVRGAKNDPHGQIKGCMRRLSEEFHQQAFLYRANEAEGWHFVSAIRSNKETTPPWGMGCFALEQVSTLVSLLLSQQEKIECPRDWIDLPLAAMDSVTLLEECNGCIGKWQAALRLRGGSRRDGA